MVNGNIAFLVFRNIMRIIDVIFIKGNVKIGYVISSHKDFENLYRIDVSRIVKNE